MYHLHTTHCRACNSESLTPVFDLGVMALANNFVRPGGEHAGMAPLSVLFCTSCSLAQLSVVVDPDILYGNYAYVTSDSKTMQKHFEEFTGKILEEQWISNVVEIGSNDGLFLEYLLGTGIESVIGIDPAANLADVAAKRGVRTIISLFDETAAKDAKKALGGLVDVVVVRHCFCHMDNWQGFVRGLEELCGDETLACIEVPYVKNLLERLEFDTIYHEHLSYLSIKAMAALLQGSQLHMHKIVPHSIHGGAITIMLRSDRSLVQPHESVQRYLDAENITVETWHEFSKGAHKLINDLRYKITQLVGAGKTVAGYGASAKSTVCVNAMGLKRNHIKFITDSTPAKQYCTCPGTDIPIVDPGAILRELPDYVLIGAWNFSTEILEKEKLARERGVRFIIPIPELKVV